LKCQACKKREVEYSYQTEEGRILVCEKCLRDVAGEGEWGDYICPVTGKMFFSESIRIEQKRVKEVCSV